MSKSSSRKRIIIAAALFAIFLIGAIVSVVVVLAAQTQNVQTNISIAYIVDGVGAKVNSSYAIVPIDESDTITRVSMKSDGSEDLNFGVSQEETKGEMQPEESLSLKSTHQQIVFEYYFESTSDAAFSIQLLDSPGMNSGDNIEEETSNMLETFCVSKTRLDVADYRDKITDSELNPQALTELGQHVYIYVSAKVKNENINAYYNGSFVWELSKQDTITVNLDDGDTTRTLKVIPTSAVADINMPCIKIPTKGGSAFAGYYLDGTMYITVDGTGVHVADLSANSTLTASWAAGMTISGTTLTAASDDAVDDTGTLTIPDGITVVGDGTNVVNTTATTVVIPNSVTTIAANAFAGNTIIETVDVTNVESASISYADETSGSIFIEANAFDGCTNLTNLNIDTNVIGIGDYAFRNCVKLTNVDILNGVKFIGQCAFSGCINITSITIPKSVKNILVGSFENCTNLKTVYFEVNSQLNIILHGAFYNCTALESITIPKSVTQIGMEAFNGCTALSSLTFEEGSNLNLIDGWAFHNCANISSLTLPNNITTLGSAAFEGCTGLTSVTIPKSVTSITNSFVGCTALADIFYAGTRAEWNATSGVESLTIPSTCVVRCSDDDLSTLPSPASYFIFSEEGTEIIGLSDEAKQIASLDLVVGGRNIVSIGSSAFANCANIKSITILDTVAVVCDAIASGCTGLKSVIIPNSVTSLLPGAFTDCTALESVVFEENSQLSMIMYSVFDGCTSLESITIPKSITSIYMEAFINCTNLTTVTFEEGSTLKEIQAAAFGGCTSLNNLIIPASVTTISGNVFGGCSSLTSVTFENPNGWTANSEALTLTDPSVNATYLTSTHLTHSWTRTES